MFHTKDQSTDINSPPPLNLYQKALIVKSEGPKLHNQIFTKIFLGKHVLQLTLPPPPTNLVIWLMVIEDPYCIGNLYSDYSFRLLKRLAHAACISWIYLCVPSLFQC